MIPTLSQYLEHTRAEKALASLVDSTRIMHDQHLYVVEEVVRDEDAVVKVTAVCPQEGSLVYFEGDSLRYISLATLH